MKIASTLLLKLSPKMCTVPNGRSGDFEHIVNGQISRVENLSVVSWFQWCNTSIAIALIALLYLIDHLA